MVERRTWDAAPKNWAGNKATARIDREQLEWLTDISTEHEHQLHALQSEEAEARHQRELLEWLADISTEHEHQLRNLQSAEAEARHQRELLEWMAQISTEHEHQLRNLQLAEGKTSEAIEYRQWLADVSTVHEAGWDPAKHPRRGASPNAGWFATTGGSGGLGSTEKHDAPHSSGMSPTPVTKPRLPADHRGTWISGKKGDGVFRYNYSLVNRQAGLAGKEVRFENQHIAIGGIPTEAYYGGSIGAATVKIETVTGTRADNLAADAAMRAKLGDPTWQRPEGYVWNHAGQPGSKKMELVDKDLHRAIGHKGPAAEPRAARRAAKAAGVTGRAMGALTVYLTARDALQAAGVLQPDYTITERETYHFVAEDGSVFVVLPAGWFSDATIEFVAGPRKGQTEEITAEQVDEYRKKAEERWGKYIPGSSFSEPRFIPGTERKSLPLNIDEYGVPREAGWIDEKGVHYYGIPKRAMT